MQTHRFAAFALCAALPLFSVAARAKEKPLQVSRGNFVFLHWERHLLALNKGSDGPRIWDDLLQSFDINGRQVMDNRSGGNSGPPGGVGGGFSGGRMGFQTYTPPFGRSMSENQWRVFQKALDDAHLAVADATYEQKGVVEGNRDTLFITVSDNDGADRTFTITNFGNTAPANYTLFVAFLQDLFVYKFQPKPATSPAPVTPK